LPPERRGAALSAIDALLGLSLSLDGARYATPYNFVRALKRGVLKLPLPSQPDAVQLLTVHGAKGLEADVVFVMDADPEPQRAETASVLVDWPMDADAPARCAFVYSESAARCPPSLRDVLAVESAAREREELNSLYVAMTRARRCLVFSATEPYGNAPGLSWWQRMEAMGTAWVPSAAPSQTALSLTDPAPAVSLLGLPRWKRASPESLTVLQEVARQPAEGDSNLSRLGQAFHRVMEWATAPGGWGAESRLTDGCAAWCALAVREFQLSSAAAPELLLLVNQVLNSPGTQRFFSGPDLLWAGNEVSVAASGDDGPQALRIDRLVALRATGGSPDSPDSREWWVLDYKLHPAPHKVPEHRAQLLRYRDAVQRLQATQSVHCAFITGAGEVFTLP
jgi:ATP-dependent helicase/nuclease subunit A